VEWLYYELALFGNIYPNGLHEAVYGKHIHILEWLISHYADINHKLGHEFETPIHVACAVGSLEIVKLFYNAGAFIDLFNREGNTPLLIACYHGHLSIVHYLYSKGAFLHQLNAYHESAMCLACDSGNLPLVEWLFENQVSPYKTDMYGRSPLARAASEGHTEIIDLLLPYNSVNSQDFTGHTPLMEACRKGHLNAAQRLYHHNALLHIQDHISHTALYYACEWGRTTIVSWLCSFGIQYDINLLQNASPSVLDILFFHGAFYDEGILTPLPESLRKTLLIHYRQRQLPLQKNIIGFDALLEYLPLCTDVGNLIGEYTGIVRGPAWSYILDAL